MLDVPVVYAQVPSWVDVCPGKGKGVMELTYPEDQKLLLQSTQASKYYYFKFWCLEESNNGLITTCLNWTPFCRAHSCFPYSITSWKLIFLAAASFGLNQINQTPPPPWPGKVYVGMEVQECWRKTSQFGSSVCLYSSHVLLVEMLALAAHSLCTI